MLTHATANRVPADTLAVAVPPANDRVANADPNRSGHPAQSERWLAFLGANGIHPKLSPSDSGDSDEREAAPAVSLGRPLDPAVRAFFEPRLGHDFGQVRIRTDPVSAASARAVNARAYTVGQEITFAPDQYLPGSEQGRELLAHELAHAVQQSDAGAARPSSADTGLIESSARGAARTVAHGGFFTGALPTAGIGLSCDTNAGGMPDKQELITEFMTVNSRLLQPDYPGRDRDLAIRDALLAAMRDDDDDEISPPHSPKPVGDDLLRPHDPRAEEGQRIMDKFENEERARRGAEAHEETQRQQQLNERAEIELNALVARMAGPRTDRRGIRALLSGLSPRTVAILRRNGLEWGRRGPTDDDLRRATENWRVQNMGGGPVMTDNYENARKSRILVAQVSGYQATIGSFVGAVSGGATRHFTDDEEIIAGVANLGATAGEVGGAVAPIIVGRIDQARAAREAENEPAEPVPARPVMRESRNAYSVTGRSGPSQQHTDEFGGQTYNVSARSGNPRSQRTAIDADIAETADYSRLKEAGEVGLAGPNGANRSGPDSITYNEQNQTIYVNDSQTYWTATPSSNKATNVPATWEAQAKQAALQADVGDPALDSAIRNAANANRIVRRNHTPQQVQPPASAGGPYVDIGDDLD